MNKKKHPQIPPMNADGTARTKPLRKSASSADKIAPAVAPDPLIGREIVEEVQRGKGRAKYGEKLIDDLSARLKARIGKGFFTTNLRYFRSFYTVYADRVPEIGRLGAGGRRP